MRMGAAAFLAVCGECIVHGGLADQVIELKRFDQIGVPDEAAIRDVPCLPSACRYLAISFSMPSAISSSVRNTAAMLRIVRCISTRTSARG
jgi:hypothetical protein